MNFLPRHLGSFFRDPRVSPPHPRTTSIEALGSRLGAAWPLAAPREEIAVKQALRAGGLDFVVTAEPVAAMLPGRAVDLFGAVDDDPVVLDAPRHRALVRDADAETACVLGVVSTTYAIAQNLDVLEAGLGLARRFLPETRPIALAAVGRPAGSTVFMAVTLGRWSSDISALLMLSNSHSGEGSVKFKVVPIHEPSATVLCPDVSMDDWTERHQGDLDRRLASLSDSQIAIPEWIEGYIRYFLDGRDRLGAAECCRDMRLELIKRLWPQTEDELWAPGNVLLEHPLRYFADLDEPQSCWSAYLSVCEFIDHYSEAREKNDSTKDRDERLVRGAGEKLKRAAWKALLAGLVG